VIGELEQKGFVTMRVEKTGEGDSEGDCTALSTTPDVEAEAYLAGLRLPKSCDFVDPARVFVFAHSMGPVVGSLAFAQDPVRGLIAVETVGTSWFEYDLERLRVQAGVSGKTPEEVDREVREYEPCSHRFYIEREKPDTLTRTQALQGLSAAFWSRSLLLHASGGRHQRGQAVAERGFSGARDLPPGVSGDDRPPKPVSRGPDQQQASGPCDLS
jgi:pimeloyl-ACP methyl ester carboxylesterase